MKVHVTRNCQPGSKRYAKGIHELPNDEARDLIERGLAEKIKPFQKRETKAPKAAKKDK